MSDSDRARAPAPHSAVTGLLIALGIILLLPGLCSLAAMAVFLGIDPRGVVRDSELISLWLMCFVVSAAGIVLIRYARKRSQPPWP